MAYDVWRTAAEPSTSLAPARAQPLRIFLAEDNPVARHAFADALDEIGATLAGRAENERGAIAWLRAHPHAWDVAVVDLFLASGSGVGVLRALADRPRTQKVLVVTNYITADLRSQCFALGANGVFDKSGQHGELMSLLQLL